MSPIAATFFSHSLHFGTNIASYIISNFVSAGKLSLATLRTNATMFDIYSSINLMALEHLFGIKPPEINDILSGRTIKSLPYIGCEAAFKDHNREW